jgi:uncharacterized protein
MTDLLVRRLLIDLDTPLPRHWNGGDAFRTAFLNALSMSFPVGEQFFIDSVRQGAKALPDERRDRFEAEVKGFIGQEATHRRVHALFNAHLARQGLVNRWAERASRRIERLKGLNVRHHLAATAAYEHFTAVLAEYQLAHPQQWEGTEPRLQTMWQWHASEESEHKSTAFDLYQALGGNHAWRLRWFRIATVYFLVDALRQTVNNLWHDRTLLRPGTWASAARFFFGRGGLVRECFGAWREYLREDFHPRQLESDRAARWLQAHAGDYRVVGEGG